MRILFISRHFYPHVGGVEKHIYEVAKKLKTKNMRISVVCQRIHNTKVKEKISGIDVYRIEYPQVRFLGLLLIWKWFWENRKLIEKSQVVHCHDTFLWYLPFRFLYFTKPVYSTFHGWEGVFPIPKKNIYFRKIAEVFSWGNICVGRYIEKWYKVKANYIVYGGVKIVNQSMSTSKSKIKILYLGRLDEDTGIKKYLQAFRLVKKKYKNVDFEFLGDGHYRGEAERLGKVHGFKTGIESHIQSSRFICTSGYMSMLEAMVAKKLVFAVSDNSLKHDVIQMSPYGNLCIHFSFPDTLARKFDYYLKNPEKEKKIVEHAFSWAKLQTWGKVADVYLKLWKVNK